MKSEVLVCTDRLGRAVDEACLEKVGKKSDVALDLVERISQRLAPDYAVKAKRFLRHCIWATRKGLTEETPSCVTPKLKKALEDTRNT